MTVDTLHALYIVVLLHVLRFNPVRECNVKKKKIVKIELFVRGQHETLNREDEWS